VLYIVLLLVLAALGLLVPALTTSANIWAWLSVGASGAAAVVLVLDWWLRRRSGIGETASVPPKAAGAAVVVTDAPEANDHQVSADDHGAVDQGGVDTEASPDQVAEPAEEDTDAADLLVVTDLSDEVRVLDERPRYHLAACSWLASRHSLGLAIQEARQLGFTPCAVCLPDSTLAAKHRASAQS
jgi:hypothetical protein